MNRRAEKVSLNRKERAGMKARDIYQKYPKAKAEKLIATLKSKGLWYFDPDFDKDEEDWISNGWWWGFIGAAFMSSLFINVLSV